MSVTAEADKVAVAARGLGPLPAREERWAQLSLCVLDAVFSIGARYSSTTRTVWAYARQQSLQHVLEPAVAVAAGEFAAGEEPVSALRDRIAELGAAEFAALIGNRQRTSTRGGVLKAEAAHDVADVLSRHGVLRLADVPDLLAASERLEPVEADLARVPGHGAAGIRTAYLWMLAGDDLHIKPDRMVLRWLSQVLDRQPSPQEATALIGAAATELDVTPWQLDHAVWNAQRHTRARAAAGERRRPMKIAAPATVLPPDRG